MASRADFTRTEWLLLGDAPLAAGAAVALSSPGGGSREGPAMIKGWRDARQLFSEQTLISEIINDLDPQDREEQELASGGRRSHKQPTYDEMLDEAIDLCERAIALLTQKATPEDTTDYKELVMHLAQTVAEATGEGGFMGIGGEAVSRAERAALREIAVAVKYGR